MVTRTLKILQQLLLDFKSVPDPFGTICIKGLKVLPSCVLLKFNKRDAKTSYWVNTCSKLIISTGDKRQWLLPLRLS